VTLNPKRNEVACADATRRGAMAVQYFGLQEWVESVTGLVALGGLIFGCGLPGWAIVRWVFNFIEKNRDAGIDEVAKEVKEVL
jgi:hypothetical protein